MPVFDDNPQNKIVTVQLIDTGNGNFPFTRTYIFNEDGIPTGDFNDFDIDGATYTPVGTVQSAASGTTTLDLSNLLSGASINGLIDVDTNTVTPAVGQVLKWDGTNWIPANDDGGAGGSSDHGLLTGLADDDHPQYLNEARGDVRYYTQAQIDTQQSTQDTNISTNSSDITTNTASIAANASAILTKYDATNPNGYETPAQLDTRDTDNRNRTNHTGTQLSSTISDFATAVRSTVLSGLNIVNEAIVATDTILAAMGKLQGQITHIIVNLLYGEFTRNEVALANNTTTEADFMTLTATTPIDGDYRMDWAYSWSSNDAAQDCIVRLYVNGVVIWTQQQEPKDVAGTGITVNNTTGGTSNSGTNQRHLVSTFDILPLIAGTNTVRMTIDSSGTADVNTIYKGVISIKKWSTT